MTRTDPLIGGTTFSYDPLNRRTSVTDPNGVQTVTAYDSLDRITAVTQKGATPAEDLTTGYSYNTLGDLSPDHDAAGNVVEYSYDLAGRLLSIERKPDANTHGDRTFYTLDSFGHRTQEDLAELEIPIRLGLGVLHQLRLLLALPPGQGDLSGWSGHRVRLCDCDNKPPAGLGREPSQSLEPDAEPELRLRWAEPPDLGAPALERSGWRHGLDHLRLRRPGSSEQGHRRRRERYDVFIQRPRPDGGAGFTASGTACGYNEHGS